MLSEVIIADPQTQLAKQVNSVFGTLVSCSEATQQLVEVGLRSALSSLKPADQKSIKKNGLQGFLSEKIAVGFKRVNAVMNQVVHAPAFQEMHTRWLALKQVVDSGVPVTIYNVNMDQLGSDVEQYGANIVASPIYRQMIRCNYDIINGKPHTVALFDHHLSGSKHNMAVASHIAKMGERGQTPVIFGASPKLAGKSELQDVTDDPEKLKQAIERLSGHYQSARELKEMMMLMFAGNKFDVRDAFDPVTNPAPGAKYFEEVTEKNSDRSWANTGYGVLKRLASSLTSNGWVSDIEGTSGGKLTGLGNRLLDDKPQLPTEARVDELTEKIYADQGLTVLSNDAMDGHAAYFMDLVTAYKAKAVLGNSAATAANRLRTKFVTVLQGSIFNQMTKRLLTKMVKMKLPKDAIQSVLQNFLNLFILPDPASVAALNPRMLDERPLSGGRVTVVEVPGSPGDYEVIQELAFHQSLNSASVETRIVPEIK